MALLKKKEADAFVVPSLAEASLEYKALLDKQTELQSRYSELHSERAKLRREIEAEEAAGKQRLAPEVARLLGDPADSVTALANRHREVAVEMGHIEVAQETLRRRLSEARNGASKAVCDGVRGEYQRRLGDVCDAAKALEAARERHDELLDDIEREDVNLAYL
ncbi:chromosome segregation ATPase [Bradyrhizobium japonicum]